VHGKDVLPVLEEEHFQEYCRQKDHILVGEEVLRLVTAVQDHDMFPAQEEDPSPRYCYSAAMSVHFLS